MVKGMSAGEVEQALAAKRKGQRPASAKNMSKYDNAVETRAEPKVSIRVLHRCNFRCPACSTFSSPERKGVLAVSDVERALEVLATEDFQGQLNFSGGETTLHPDLPAMLALAAERLGKAHVAVFTNGDWVGPDGWEDRLHSFLAGPNVLVRFSLDRQHAGGAALARGEPLDEDRVRAVEAERFDKARMFLEACRALGAKPGANYDFAFKGSFDEGREYTACLGDVPLYLIRFREDPSRRPKAFGFLAVDVDEDGRVLVFPTLGHIPSDEPLGGLETLAEALAMNRDAFRGGRADG